MLSVEWLCLLIIVWSVVRLSCELCFNRVHFSFGVELVKLSFKTVHVILSLTYQLQIPLFTFCKLNRTVAYLPASEKQSHKHTDNPNYHYNSDHTPVYIVYLTLHYKSYKPIISCIRLRIDIRHSLTVVRFSKIRAEGCVFAIVNNLDGLYQVLVGFSCRKTNDRSPDTPLIQNRAYFLIGSVAVQLCTLSSSQIKVGNRCFLKWQEKPSLYRSHCWIDRISVLKFIELKCDKSIT